MNLTNERKLTAEEIQERRNRAKAAIENIRLNSYRRLVSIELKLRDLQAEKDELLNELEHYQEDDELLAEQDENPNRR